MNFIRALFEINQGKVLGRKSVRKKNPSAVYKDKRFNEIILQYGESNFSNLEEYFLEFDGDDVMANDWEYVKLVQ